MFFKLYTKKIAEEEFKKVVLQNNVTKLLELHKISDVTLPKTCDLLN